MKKAEKQKIKSNEIAVTNWRDFLGNNGFAKIRKAEKVDHAGGGGTIYVEYGKDDERVLIRQDFDDDLNIIEFRVFRANAVSDPPNPTPAEKSAAATCEAIDENGVRCERSPGHARSHSGLAHNDALIVWETPAAPIADNFKLDDLEVFNFEIYTKNPETGETGWNIEFVNAFGVTRADAIEHLRQYPNFDCIITATAAFNGCKLDEADVAAFAAGAMFRKIDDAADRPAREVNPDIAYRGRVVAKTGELLPGGVKAVESSLFWKHSDAADWIAAVTNAAGDKVKTDRVITVNLSGTGIDRSRIL